MINSKFHNFFKKGIKLGVREILLLVGGVCFSFFVNAGSKKFDVDSLLMVIKHEKDDSLKAWYLQRLGDYYRNFSPDSANFWYKRSLRLSEEIKNEFLIANQNSRLGDIQLEFGNFDEALNLYKKAGEIYNKGNRLKELSYTYCTYGRVYWKTGDFKSALIEYFKALRISEDLEDEEGLARCSNGIGLLYWDQQSYIKALEFYKKALKIEKKRDNKSGLCTLYNNMGLII